MLIIIMRAIMVAISLSSIHLNMHFQGKSVKKLCMEPWLVHKHKADLVLSVALEYYIPYRCALH